MPLVPVGVVRSLTAAGTPDQCREQVAAYSIRPNIYPAPTADHRELRGDHRGVRSPPGSWSAYPWCCYRIPDLLNLWWTRLGIYVGQRSASYWPLPCSRAPVRTGIAAVDERVTALEAKARSLERSIEALADENAELKSQIAILEGQTGSVARHQEESSIDAVVQLDDLDARVQELEKVASGVEPDLPATEQRPKGKEGKQSQPEGSALERTVRLVEDSGRTVHYIDHPQRDDRSVLVMPRETVDSRTPLIVSLHGFGGDSAHHTTYVPPPRAREHRRVRSAATQRHTGQWGEPFLEPHRRMLRVRQGRPGRCRLPDRTGSESGASHGLRAGVLLRVLQRRVHGVPHCLQGSARPPCRGQPGRHELRPGRSMRRGGPRVRVAHPRHRRRRYPLRG